MNPSLAENLFKVNTSHRVSIVEEDVALIQSEYINESDASRFEEQLRK